MEQTDLLKLGDKNKTIMFTLFVAIIIMIELFKGIIEIPSFNNSIILFIIEYIIITLIFLLYAKKKILTMKNIFVFVFSFMIGLSPVFYYINMGDIKDSSHFTLIIISYLMLAIGMNLNIKWKSKKINTESKYRIKLEDICIIIGLISLIANVCYIFINRAYLLSGDIEAGRTAALSSNGIFIVLMNLIIPMIGLLFDIYLKKDSKKILLFVIIFIMGATLCYLIQGTRTPIMKIIILMLLIYNFRRNIKNHTVIIIAIMGIVLLIGMQVMRTQRSSESIGFSKSLLDTLQNGSVNLQYVQNTFPEKEPYQKGYTYFINLIMLLPGEDIDFTLWVKDKLNLDFAGGGVTPTIIGESYINFGNIGTYIILFFIGTLINYIDNKYSDNKNEAFWICYFVTIFIDSFRGGMANIEVSLLIYLALYIFIEKMLKISKKSVKECSNENSNDRT